MPSVLVASEGSERVEMSQSSLLFFQGFRSSNCFVVEVTAVLVRPADGYILGRVPAMLEERAVQGPSG
jgi:hypothetical protein